MLLDASREAHWTLRVRLQELSGHPAASGIAAIYDEARHCDNLLTEFHRARADALARQVRDLPDARTSHQSSHGDVVARLTVSERALLGRMRELGPDDRLALLRLAVCLATSAAAAPTS